MNSTTISITSNLTSAYLHDVGVRAQRNRRPDRLRTIMIALRLHRLIIDRARLLTATIRLLTRQRILLLGLLVPGC